MIFIKSSLSNYKEYPIPIRFYLTYIILVFIGVALIDLVATYLIKIGIEDFLDLILGFALLLVGFAICVIILAFVTGLFCIGKKIYRGIGIYIFMTVTSCLSPIFFIGCLIVFPKIGIEISFFNGATLFLQCLMPVCVMFFMRLNLHRCDRCGLIKTLNNFSSQTESLDKRVKYHNEGGYYVNNKSSGSITGTNMQGLYNVNINTRQYVPKTTVRDGEFERKRYTTTYECGVCGNRMKDVFVSETKIGD